MSGMRGTHHKKSQAYLSPQTTCLVFPLSSLCTKGVFHPTTFCSVMQLRKSGRMAYARERHAGFAHPGGAPCRYSEARAKGHRGAGKGLAREAGAQRWGTPRAPILGYSQPHHQHKKRPRSAPARRATPSLKKQLRQKSELMVCPPLLVLSPWKVEGGHGAFQGHNRMRSAQQKHPWHGAVPGSLAAGGDEEPLEMGRRGLLHLSVGADATCLWGASPGWAWVLRP